MLVACSQPRPPPYPDVRAATQGSPEQGSCPRCCPWSHLQRSEHGGGGCSDGLRWAEFLGRCLGGGGRGCLLLLGGGLHQCQLLGQARAGFHDHIMFNLLPDPDFQVLLELSLLHNARLLGGDNTTSFPRGPVPLRSRRGLALHRLPRLELALPLRHDRLHAGRGGAVNSCSRKGARHDGIHGGWRAQALTGNTMAKGLRDGSPQEWVIIGSVAHNIRRKDYKKLRFTARSFVLQNVYCFMLFVHKIQFRTRVR